MSTITIADHQTDVILDDIASDFYWDDKHSKNLRNNKETFGFTTFADKSFSEFLAKRNRIIIPDEDGELIELSIMNTRKYRQSNGALLCDVRTSASFIDLKQEKIIRPHVTSALSAEAHAREALNGTEYEVGTIDFKGVRTFIFEEMTNPYAYLHRIASEFGLELHFRVESDGNKITRRYVDLIERVGSWNGREVTFGRDLEGIERIEDFSHIVTALIGIGPEREDGTRLEVLVENEEALQRWGRNNQHRIEIYEPMSDDPDMTESRLRKLTENELEKRINSQVQYIANIIDLANVVGLEHEKMRFGDTVRIKDLKFNPPLYLEARIHTVERSIKNLTRKTVVLGDYIEYTEEDVMALIRTLQKEVNKKIGLGTLSEVTYTKPEIDEKDERGNQAADKIETDVGWVTPIESTTGAQEKANQAKDDANDYTDGIKQQIDAELLEKTDYEYVDGQLQLKADSETVQSINNTVEGLEQTANGLLQSVADNVDALEAQGGRITTVETDLDEVEGQLSLALTDLSTLNGTVSQHGTQISANTEAIGLKASQSDLDTLSGDVSSISGQLTVMSGEIEAKAERSELESLEGNVTTISNDLASLSVAYDGITADIQSIEATTDGLTTDISNLNTDIQAVAGEVNSKVSAEYVTGAIADIEIGGRNLVSNSNDFSNLINYQGATYTISTDVSVPEWKVDNASRVTTSGGNHILKVYNQFSGIVIPGNTYTVSVYVKNNSSNRMMVLLPDFEIAGEVIIGAGESKRVIYTGTSRHSTAGRVQIQYRAMAVSENLDITLFGIQLEKGNKATDWSPAPEDVQAEIDSVYSYASSEISQLSGRIDLKADSTIIEGIESRVTSAELSIDGLEGQISSKVEADDVRSIFTQEAGSFTFSANQINFDGHVFGQNATFEGHLEGVSGTFQEITQENTNRKIVLDDFGLDVQSKIDNSGVALIGSVPFGDGSSETTGSAVAFYHKEGNEVKWGSWLDETSYGELSITSESVIINRRTGSVPNQPALVANGRIRVSGVDFSSSLVSTSTGDFPLRPNGSNDVRIANSAGEWRNVRGLAFINSSNRDLKKNIEPYGKSALNEILSTPIYNYHFKEESDTEQKHVGVILQEAPVEIADIKGQGVDSYAMIALGWKGIQELNEKVVEHYDELNYLRMEIQYLRGVIEQIREESE